MNGRTTVAIANPVSSPIPSQGLVTPQLINGQTLSNRMAQFRQVSMAVNNAIARGAKRTIRSASRTMM